MPLGDWAAERDALFELTREAEEAARRSAEAQSSVALRVRTLEANMRLIEAYGSTSTPTQRMVEGAVIERHRRRVNILHSQVDDRGRPFDVDTDEEADEEIRRELLEEGFIRIDASAGQSQQRAWYARRDSTTPEILRFVSPEPFISAVEESSSDEETVEAEPEPEPRPMSIARREALVTQVRQEIERARSNQSPQGGARHEALWHREEQLFYTLQAAGVPIDQPPVGAVVPQEEEQEPVWYYRRAREMALEDAERMQEPLPEPLPEPAPVDATTPPVAGRGEQARWPNTARLAREVARSNHASAAWQRQSVRTDIKTLLHIVQQKLEVEQERSAAGQTFSEGSYLELSDLLRDMFLCVDRI